MLRSRQTRKEVSKTMYKTELVKAVAKETRLSQRVVGEVLDATTKEIQGTLAGGKTVNVLGFGTFYTRQREAGKVQDIRTRQEISVPAMRVAAFRAGDVLRQAVR